MKVCERDVADYYAKHQKLPSDRYDELHKKPLVDTLKIRITNPVHDLLFVEMACLDRLLKERRAHKPVGKAG